MILYDFIQQLSYMSGRFEYEHKNNKKVHPWEHWKLMFSAWLEDQPIHERGGGVVYTPDSDKPSAAENCTGCDT